jgi:hypothetical protein
MAPASAVGKGRPDGPRRHGVAHCADRISNEASGNNVVAKVTIQHGLAQSTAIYQF